MKSNGGWAAVRPLLGNTLGVGLFALPYAVAQAGVISGALALLICGLLSLVTLLALSELSAAAGKNAHFVGVLRPTRFITQRIAHDHLLPE